MGVRLRIALTGSRGFFRRGASVRRRARRGGIATDLAASVSGGVAGVGASSGAGFLAATVVLVHGGPGPGFGFVFGNAAMLIALGDVVGFAFLFVGVLGLSPRGMDCLLVFSRRNGEEA